MTRTLLSLTLTIFCAGVVLMYLVERPRSGMVHICPGVSGRLRESFIRSPHVCRKTRKTREQIVHRVHRAFNINFHTCYDREFGKLN
jgi:hypothetical protein